MPGIHLYNSLSKKLELFEPREPGKVSIYNCGPTVYKRQHIGNMRRFLFADFLRRTLEMAGYEVKDITNITDVGHLTEDDIEAGEDKMEKAAREAKMTPQAIAEEQTHLFFEDIAALAILPAHMYPRASQHIPHMQRMIQTLIDKGFAYQTEAGVYFDVTTFPAYGSLSGNTVKELNAGARVEIRPDKKHPADFALWILDNKQLQLWDSPWGQGYPGWHIECSAMSLEYLGATIDIHTGGEDNKFPHHENEIAQSESSSGETFVHTWMHNSHLQLDGKKLSKREGEQITLDTIREKNFSPLAFRLLVFASHYRMKMDFSWELLTTFENHLASITQLLRLIHELKPINPGTPDKAVIDSFMQALADDLNTPKAWALFLQYVKDSHIRLISQTEAQNRLATLMALDKVLGVITPLYQSIEHEAIPAQVIALRDARDTAKTAKQYEEADRIRIEIETLGYKVEDTVHGTRIIAARKNPNSPA